MFPPIPSTGSPMDVTAAQEMPIRRPVGDDDLAESIGQKKYLPAGEPLLDPREESIVDVLADAEERFPAVKIVKGDEAGKAERPQQMPGSDHRQINGDGDKPRDP